MPFCIKCGSELKAQFKFCGSCGAPVNKPISLSLVCVNCNTPLKNGDKFCFKCGFPIMAATASSCKNCNAKLLTGDKFCIKCGTPVVPPSVEEGQQKNDTVEKTDEPDQSAIEKKKADDEYQLLKDKAINDYNELANSNSDASPEELRDLWYGMSKQIYDVYKMTEAYPDRSEDTSILRKYLDDSKSRTEKYIYMINLNSFNKNADMLQLGYAALLDMVQKNSVEDEYEMLKMFKDLHDSVSSLADEYYKFNKDDLDGESLARLQSNIDFYYCCLLYAMNRYEDNEGEPLSKQQVYDYNAECAEISSAFEHPKFYALLGLSSYRMYLACVSNEKHDDDESEQVVLSKDKSTAYSEAKKAFLDMKNFDYCFKISAYSESKSYFEIAEWENAANGLVRLFNIHIKDGEYEEAYELAWMAIESHAAAASRRENANAKGFVDSFTEKHNRFSRDEDGDLIYKK